MDLSCTRHEPVSGRLQPTIIDSGGVLILSKITKHEFVGEKESVLHGGDVAHVNEHEIQIRHSRFGQCVNFERNLEK